MIDWKKTQLRIGAASDGDPGRETLGRLMAMGAERRFDETMLRLGESAAKHFPAFGVLKNPRLLTGFIAETAHETMAFSRWEEDLRYSAQGLADTWPNRFAVDPGSRPRIPNDKAKRLARRPADIARATYADRMGNVDAENDNDQNEDGWQYRGRGMTMLTGKGAYAEMGGKIGIDLVRFPELAADPATSLLIACRFYDDKKVFEAMAIGDDQLERRRVNGGLIGFDAVQQIRARLKRLVVVQ